MTTLDPLTDIIDLVHPSENSTGIVTSDQIWILFSQEIDETTISAGNLFLSGPDTQTYSGPGLEFYNSNVKEILSTPGYTGFVPGSLSFKRIQNSQFEEINIQDIDGTGTLFRTQVLFTPSKPLAKNTEYTVYLFGDENEHDAINTGIKTRTVFDTVDGTSNTGGGSVIFKGGYFGVADDKYIIKITTPGKVGTSQFVWWKENSPSVINGPLVARSKYTELSSGVSAVFEKNIVYEVNDQYSAVVKTPTIFSGNLVWIFSTGSGSIKILPTSTSTSIIGTTSLFTPSTIADPTTPLQIVEITPDNRSTNMPLTTRTIYIKFNKNIDEQTVLTNSVKIKAIPTIGETGTVPIDIQADGDFEPNVTVIENIMVITF